MATSLRQSVAQALGSISDSYSSRPLSVSTLFTTLFTVCSVTALFVESSRRCNPDLQLWLGVMTVYGFVRYVLRLFMEAVTLEYIRYPGNITVVYKVIEMVDIFGMVWFSVGNLLVFNGIKCSQSDLTPMTFWVCLVYIILGYLSLILPMALRMCTATTQQVTPNDRVLHPNETAADVAARNETWRRWLISYSCYPKPYATIKDNGSKDSEGVEPSEAAESGVIGATPMATHCPVCLVDFEADAEVVNYPCRSRTHYFHSSCMYDWLKVASRRGFDNITCPCCREAPSMHGLSRAHIVRHLSYVTEQGASAGIRRSREYPGEAEALTRQV